MEEIFQVSTPKLIQFLKKKFKKSIEVKGLKSWNMDQLQSLPSTVMVDSSSKEVQEQWMKLAQ